MVPIPMTSPCSVCKGRNGLYIACHLGHFDCARLLCKAGVDVNQAHALGNTPLLMACLKGHIDCARVLCEAGADVSQANEYRVTPLYVACKHGHDGCARLLSSYDASRDGVDEQESLTPESGAEGSGHTMLLAWLVQSREWTPLHHVDIITTVRARALLRAGANLHAGSPSPLDLAKHSTSDASKLLRRAERWSLSSHELFPAPLRARAMVLLRFGYLLAWSPRFETESASLVDSWRDCVLPHAVLR